VAGVSFDGPDTNPTKSRVSVKQMRANEQDLLAVEDEYDSDDEPLANKRARTPSTTTTTGNTVVMESFTLLQTESAIADTIDAMLFRTQSPSVTAAINEGKMLIQQLLSNLLF
jgi:hypothetical protein